MNLFEVFIDRQDDIIKATIEHIELSFVAVLIAILIAVPVGILLTSYQKLATPIIEVTSVFQTIPSLALLGVMIPLLGIGWLPAIVALTVIMAGVRTATVLIIGVATLASLIGVGGLGDLIFRGIGMSNTELILAGAIPAAVLALIFDKVLEGIEKLVTPKGLKK